MLFRCFVTTLVLSVSAPAIARQDPPTPPAGNADAPK